jgi:hypothetical protein
MSFQQHRTKTEDWRAWLRNHRSTLAECGLPDSVLRDRPRWNSFLNHGYCQETGWRLDMLSPQGARALYHFLLAECGDSVAGRLLGNLGRMFSQGWLEAVNPDAMLPQLPSSVSERKLRLWAVACCRRIEAALPDRSLRWVEAAARFADGLASAEELVEADAVVGGDPDDDYSECLAAMRAAALPFGTGQASACADGAARAAARARDPVAVFYAPYAAAMARERLVQCQLLRCIFGNPSVPLSADRQWLRWNDGCVVRVATVIYQEERFEELPVLADALEDAGCTDAGLLRHLREEGLHVRGCVAVDAVLGKS